MLRAPKLYNEDFLNENGSLRNIAKLKNLGATSPINSENLDPSGTSFPEMQNQYPEIQAMSPASYGDIRKNESPYFKLGRYLGTQQQQQEEQQQPPLRSQKMALASAEEAQAQPVNPNASEGVFKSLSSLAQMGGTPTQETQQVPAEGDLPSMGGMPEQQMPVERAPMPSPTTPQEQLQITNQIPSIQARKEERQIVPTPSPSTAPITAEVKRLKDEGKAPIFAAPDAIETALATPKYKDILNELYGGEIEPEMMKKLTDYEKSLTEEELSTDKEIAEIQKRKDEGKLTTQDKIMMGLVLLAPAIIGGVVAGKEGLFGALGGGLEGLSTALQAQEEQKLLDTEKLAKAHATKSEISLKKVAANQALLDAIPNAGLKKILKSRGIEEVVDGEGNVKAYGIPTPDKSLFIDASAIKSEKDLERFDKDDVPAMKEANGLAININDALDDMDFLLDQLKGKTPGGQILGEKLPFLQDKIMTREGDIITAGEALETIDQILRDRYRKAAKIKGFGPEVTEHFGGLLIGPYDKESVWKGRDMKTVVGKARQFRGLMNKAHERNLESAGFLAEPFKAKIAESGFVGKADTERQGNKLAKYFRDNPKEWEKAKRGEFVGGPK